MNFTQIPAAWVAAGLAALAAALYLLQRLRIRHRPVTVVTTLFWRVAAAEAPARTLVERFRHPWAFALILLILSLLWLAFAGPEPRRTEGGAFRVLVLDGSAGMAAGNRFATAVGALNSFARGLPADQRQVLWVGAGVRTLLNPGEHALLLEKRLAGLAPEPAPAGIETLLRQLAATQRPGRSTEVVIFGDAPVRAETLALTPDLRVTRAQLGSRATTRNAGITALGVADAASGAWDRVDVFVRVEATDGMPLPRPAADLDGRELVAAELRAAPGAAGGFLLANLPATGGLLTVRLPGDDALALDNTARVRLPDKPRLKVLLSPSLADALRPVLTADPAVQLVDSGAQVVVRRAGESAGGALPALEFVRAEAGRPAFLIVHPEKLDDTTVFEHAVAALGLKEIDAMALAEAARRPVEVSVAAGSQWRFEVWADLLSEEFNFTQSRAFPLFIANTLRWLAGTRAALPVVAAGHPLAGAPLAPATRVLGSDGRALDPLGVAFVPEQAGELKVENEPHPLAVALLDPLATVPAAALTPAPARLGATALAAHPITWLLLGALLLLGLEWHLHQTGRVP